MRTYDIQEFVQVVLSGMSYDEIGTEYGITRDCVRQRVFQLKKRGYIPETFDGRKNNRKHLVISKKVNTGVNQQMKLCVSSCNECTSKCDALKVIETLVHNGISIRVGNKIYMTLRSDKV